MVSSSANADQVRAGVATNVVALVWCVKEKTEAEGRSKVDAGTMGSENVMVSRASRSTFRVPLAGEEERMVGGSISSVVNRMEAGLESPFP